MKRKPSSEAVFTLIRRRSSLILVNPFSTRLLQSGPELVLDTPTTLMSVWMKLYFKARMGTQRLTLSFYNGINYFSGKNSGAKDSIIVNGVKITDS